MRAILYFTLLIFGTTYCGFAQKTSLSRFQVVPLGVKGGSDETNLSAYLLAPINSQDYICLDAGTINAGIEKAIANTTFTVSANTVLQEYIKGYFISHAHLDHVSGLIINSPTDAAKTVYATNQCMQLMQKHYFNGETWANFGDAGLGFPLKKYHFQTLQPLTSTAINNTTMTVKAFPLSHVNPYESTAFLLKDKDAYALYLGDTGADRVEKSTHLFSLWVAIAPLIKNKQLKGLFIEVSFPNEQPEGSLYGHLTPKLLLEELEVLANLTGEKALQSCKIVITHLKPPTSAMLKIKEQLIQENNLGLDLYFPEQGVRFEL
ncbi:3',5'-cyclic-nucleotide phosphodiesterase [Flavobacterium sp.]|uniref:MBL fold metallo-hydrolase n=1 Tax=Flavobacterium sp. TaxID=239 RepID=UPI0026255D55|nr:3',5'-cyclic-nucleotide phosphodiesterase [Flavobacterium sp.]MDG2431211.1 3',5'-cyclic-nucleotide phosphodiesterase [Flavobacterium sp.]